MPSRQSSVAAWARAFRAITALTIISTAAASNHLPGAMLLNVPLSFEPNRGQAASTVSLSRAALATRSSSLRARFVLNLERRQPASPTPCA